MGGSSRVRAAATKLAAMAGGTQVVVHMQRVPIWEMEGAAKIGLDLSLPSDAGIDAADRDAMVDRG